METVARSVFGDALGQDGFGEELTVALIDGAKSLEVGAVSESGIAQARIQPIEGNGGGF